MKTALKSNYKFKVRTPHEQQHKFTVSKAKRKVIRAGRRSGKTVGIARLAVIWFAAGKRVLYTAPTIEQLESFWYEVNRTLRELIDAGVYHKNEAEHFLERMGT